MKEYVFAILFLTDLTVENRKGSDAVNVGSILEDINLIDQYGLLIGWLK